MDDPNKQFNNKDEIGNNDNLDDDYNPYREEVQKNNPSAFIDPEKGNISEQLGQDFCFPTDEEVNAIDNNNQNTGFNDAHNLNNNNNLPQSDNDFSLFSPDNNKDIVNNNNNNNQFSNDNNANNFNNPNLNNNNQNYNNFNPNNNNFNPNNNNFNNNNNVNNSDFLNNNNFNNFNNNNNNFNNNNNYNRHYSQQINPPPGIQNNNNDPNRRRSTGTQSDKIQSIIKLCESKYEQSITLFQSFKIKEAKDSLTKIVDTLDKIATMPESQPFFQDISNIRQKSSDKLNDYKLISYQIIPLKFKRIVYNPQEDLASFAKKFLFYTPFISFDDLYEVQNDPAKKVKTVLTQVFERSQKSGSKALLLFGPRGSGKTLAAHALAREIGGIIAQLEGPELFQINYFVKEFARVSLEMQGNRPLIVFVRNIDTLYNVMGPFMFLFDKFSMCSNKVLFIASSSTPINNLPPQIGKKFLYSLCIRPAPQNLKFALFKFISNNSGIKLDMSDQEIMNIVNNSLRTYSNADIFQLLKLALDLKKQNGDLKGGVTSDYINKALQIVPGSLTPQIMKCYYL